jgi:hypothetical protein
MLAAGPWSNAGPQRQSAMVLLRSDFAVLTVVKSSHTRANGAKTPNAMSSQAGEFDVDLLIRYKHVSKAAVVTIRHFTQ